VALPGHALLTAAPREPSMPSSAYLRVIRAIDKLTSAISALVVLLLVPLILANAIEVLMRYVFNSPTAWAADVTVMSSGTLFMLGSAYALLKGAHVRTDMLWEKFSDRTKGLIDSVTYLAFFLPAMAVLFVLSWDDFLYAWSIDERSNLSSWQPVLWPFRGVIPLTALMLFVQGVSELLKSLWAARTGTLLAHHEKIEL
jgi:TRAP-type mannitol/chloroaromatic compound transport system permease small subunit